MSKTVGIVVVTEFCAPDSNKFQGYISYIDREEAVRRENVDEYSLFSEYLEYVGNPKKASGLFTNEKDELSSEQKKILKDVFKTAQENGSLMWQTVISFDNVWLKEHGYYDDKIGLVQEKKFMSAVRAGINAMLKNEDLENAMWAADIHHNTDNIHVHVATVEPKPQREKRPYIQYEKVIEDGKWKYKKRYNEVTGRKEKIPIIGDDGKPLIREEFKGKFKSKSIKACKSKIVNELTMAKDINIDITRIIREKLIDKEAISGLYDDVDFRQRFVDLYNKMPVDVSRKLWTYNSNVMKPLKHDLDALTTKYIEKYHKDDFEALKRKLEDISSGYAEGYGSLDKTFMENKIADIYARIGNKILKEIRYLDEQTNKKVELREQLVHKDGMELIDDEIINIEEGTGYINWSENYQQAKKFIFEKQEYEKAQSLLQEEAKKGNALALHDLGDIYRLGRGKEIDPVAANKYYAEALNIFRNMYENDKSLKVKMKSYLAYRIGKMYNYGLGVEEDKSKAADWFEEAIGNKFANYSLGSIYYRGEGRTKDLKRAAELYKKSEGFPYAEYKLGVMYERGEGVPKDAENAKNHYSVAYQGFLESEKSEYVDDNTVYRLGMMEWQGKGTEKDLQKAEKHLKKASQLGNTYAKYTLAQFYLSQNPDEEKMKEIIELLTVSANKGRNNVAMYALGKLYNNPEHVFYNQNVAIKWYEKAAALNNDYAVYRLGIIYTSPELQKEYGDKGVKYLERAAANQNPYAQLKLGLLYYKGEVVERNISAAFDCLNHAKEGGVEFAADIIDTIKDRERRKIRSNQNFKLLDNRDLKMSLIYLRRSLMTGNEHILNMKKYNEMMQEIEEEYQ